MYYYWTEEHYRGLKKIDPQYIRFSNIVRELNKASEKVILRRLATEMIIEWRDEYNVGVEEIDLQHKLFFRIIKKMSDLHIKTGNRGDDVIRLDRLLDELLNYAHLHFQSEELLMARYRYPLIHNQKKEHEIIMSELNKRVKAIRYSNGSTVKLVYFLVQWFIKHTVYSDRDIGVFVIRQRKERAFRVNLKCLTQKIKVLARDQPPIVASIENSSIYSVG